MICQEFVFRDEDVDDGYVTRNATGGGGLWFATGAERPRNDNIRKGQKKDGLLQQPIF